MKLDVTCIDVKLFFVLVWEAVGINLYNNLNRYPKISVTHQTFRMTDLAVELYVRTEPPESGGRGTWRDFSAGQEKATCRSWHLPNQGEVGQGAK